MIPANRSKSKQEIPAHEDHLIHAEIETLLYNQNTGEKLSTPFVQSYTQAEFKQAKESGAFTGMSVTVIHEPKGAEAKEGAKAAAAQVGENIGAKNTITDRERLRRQYVEVLKKEPDPNLTKKQLQNAIAGIDIHKDTGNTGPHTTDGKPIIPNEEQAKKEDEKDAENEAKAQEDKFANPPKVGA